MYIIVRWRKNCGTTIKILLIGPQNTVKWIKRRRTFGPALRTCGSLCFVRVFLPGSWQLVQSRARKGMLSDRYGWRYTLCFSCLFFNCLGSSWKECKRFGIFRIVLFAGTVLSPRRLGMGSNDRWPFKWNGRKDGWLSDKGGKSNLFSAIYAVEWTDEVYYWTIERPS